MPEVILAHCWTGAPEQAWYPAFREALEAEGWRVAIPRLPASETPDPDAWLRSYAVAVGRPSRHTFLVGHSLGCATVLRLLERLPAETAIGGVLLVAGFARPLGIAAIDAFHAGDFDWDHLRRRGDRTAVLLGTEDPYLRGRLKQESDHFGAVLRADVWWCAGGGHFSHASGCRELPQAVSLVRHLAELTRQRAHGAR